MYAAVSCKRSRRTATDRALVSSRPGTLIVMVVLTRACARRPSTAVVVVVFFYSIFITATVENRSDIRPGVRSR